MTTKAKSQIGKASKAKGSSGELELSKLIKSYGFEAERSQQFCGKGTDASDVRSNIPGLYIESKRYAADHHKAPGMIAKWMEQVKEDCPDGLTPVVFYRADRQDWFAYFYSGVTTKIITTKPVLVRVRASEFLEALAEACQCKRCGGVMNKLPRIICKDCEVTLSNGTTTDDTLTNRDS